MSIDTAGRSASGQTHLGDFVRSLLPGVFAGVLIVIMSVSLSALIFSGPLSPYLVDGIAMSIIAAAVVGSFFALAGSFHPLIPQVDEDTAPIFALLVITVTASMPAGDHASAATLFAAIFIATLFAGAGLMLLGYFRIGAFIQFLPHSVMGGYFAALGWLLIVGGIGASAPDDVGSVNALTSWIPAMLLGAWLLLMKHRLSRVWLLPGTVTIAATLWFGIGSLMSVGPAEMLRSGYLIGPFEESRALFTGLFGGTDLTEVQWRFIESGAGSIGTILLISVMSLLLSVSGLGLLYRRDPDMNRELKIAGLANVASGFGGGLMALPSYNLSAQAHEMHSPPTRWTGLVAVAVCVAIFVVGLEVIAFAPRFIIGGVLVYLGASLVREWLIDGWFKFAFLEYLVIPVILISAITLGFLESILVGLIAAIVVFVVKYSRIKVVRFSASCEEVVSNVDRNVVAEQYIRENSTRLFVLGLQGYLFFGTAGRVRDALVVRLNDEGLRKPDSVIIDFSQVSGVDASAALNFQKIERMAAAHGFKLILAGLDDELRERLERGGFGAEQPESLIYMSDLDHAVEWAEERILAGIEGARETRSCFEQIRPYLGSDEDVEILRSYLEYRRVDAGTTLTEQGAASTELFFVETCAASAFIEQADGQALRVRTTEKGTVYGELGFYIGAPRTASVRTDEAGIVYVLSLDALKKMEQEHSEVAAGLHRFMAMLLSERLLNTTRSLQAVML